ncbi:P-loop NTPase fold protein [Pectobacterium brasiliense]|uniref:KAP family P-loop NTPase fold protein n=2 Tax=Pectobacterium brasiliense TaxID=180957 RepID=UPI00057E937B|nr:P-loop NTPase fold protein [Pectobacterium brasiliense]KHS98325.1 NTPase [Pectobacterium brasiliense]MDY4349807.1 P-loop NTPase fold protein [Pectobacterium brasiliense]
MESKNYSSDSPIYDQEHDRFSRWGFSERIAQVISRRSDPSSIVIGLYGIWGDGKTSVLNFIEKSLETDENVICIKFNPWRFGAEEELLTGFFFDIAQALDAELIKTGDKFKDFIKKAAPGAGAIFGAKGAGDAIGSFISGPDINELKKRIESELEVAKKRVLILIDDVDRLDKAEIHAIFRLVKLTAGFKYTSYILAFDKDVVTASLQDRYSSSAENAGEAFLEKIIQVPLHLPSVEKRVLREFCFHGVEEALEIAGIKLTEQQVQEFVRDFSGAFDVCLTTPRKAKLYGNILMFSLPILQGEVNPVDLMLVEGIRVFCPSLYEILRTNKSLFSGTFGNSQYSTNDSEKERIRTLIDNALSSGININKEGFIDLLKNMFPKLQAVYGNMNYGSDWHEKWNKAQRVCSENYFSRYFTYSIPAGDISDKSIQVLADESEVWKEPFESERNPLNHILTSISAETLIKKLRGKAGEISASASVSLAIAFSKKSDVIPNPEILYSWLAPFSQAAMLVSQLIQNLDKKQRADLAKTCINTAPSLEFKLEIFKWLKREDENKPEKDAFPEAVINDIGSHLGKVVSDLLENSEDITKLPHKTIPTIFYTLNKFVRDDYVNEYVGTLISKAPESIISILDAYVPTAWGMESGISHKSDFEREQYNSVTSVLDPIIILKAIEVNFPAAMKKLDEYPRVYDDGAEKRLLFLEQFIWIHRYVLNESQKSDESDENETQA